MSLDLKINSVHMELGGTMDDRALDEAALHKPNPLRRLFKNPPNGQILYEADNCKLECFDEEFTIYPCTHGYLTPDRQWETKATVFLDEGRVCKLEFQVLEGRYAASNFIERFHEVCSVVLGKPVESSPHRSRWHNGKALVACILHPDKVNADFLMELIDN
jgi:hypothetical protein